jgi:sulfite exporter TauE/SafE
MVYVAIFGAIAMQSVSLGVAYMLLFGVGTIPMLTVVVYVSKFLSFSFRNALQKGIPIVAIIIGMLFIIRGLGLDIPYLSPSNLSLFVQSEANCH